MGASGEETDSLITFRIEKRGKKCKLKSPAGRLWIAQVCEAPRHLNFYERKIKVPEAAALVNAMIKLPICAYLSKGMEAVNKLSELIF